MSIVSFLLSFVLFDPIYLLSGVDPIVLVFYDHLIYVFKMVTRRHHYSFFGPLCSAVLVRLLLCVYEQGIPDLSAGGDS